MRFNFTVPTLRIHPIVFRPPLPIPRKLALGLLLAVAGVLSGFAVGELPIGNPLTAISSMVPEPPSRTLPPELPKEWRWKREPVTFDHMYMEPRNPRKLDWIRNDGRSRR